MLRCTAVAFTLLTVTASAESVTLPDVLYSGAVTPQATSTPDNIDLPKLTPGVNATSYDW